MSDKQKILTKYVNDFLDYLELQRNSSPLTQRNYRHYLHRFTLWLGSFNSNLNLKRLSVKDISRYRLYLSRLETKPGRTLSRATQAYHIICLRSFFKYLIKQDIPVLAPEKIELPKSESKSFKYLTTEQVERLLSGPGLTGEKQLRDKAILEVLFSTGLRVAELVGLNRDSVDLDRREFGVIGKGGRPRVVFLSKRAAKWLKAYLDKRPDQNPALFVSRAGRLTSRSVQRLVGKYCRQAKLPLKITPHGLRHSMATDLLRNGADIRVVQEILGHKNIATTQIYTHITNQQLKRAHDQFHSLRE